MAVKKSDLYSSLWASCDELRGGMDASQDKDYVLFMLFIDRIKTSAMATGPVTPAIDAQLNERQQKAMAEVLGIAYDTANRDLIGLGGLKLLERTGRGRASKYVPFEEKGRL